MTSIRFYDIQLRKLIYSNVMLNIIPMVLTDLLFIIPWYMFEFHTLNFKSSESNLFLIILPLTWRLQVAAFCSFYPLLCQRFLFQSAFFKCQSAVLIQHAVAHKEILKTLCKHSPTAQNFKNGNQQRKIRCSGQKFPPKMGSTGIWTRDLSHPKRESYP